MSTAVSETRATLSVRFVNTDAEEAALIKANAEADELLNAARDAEYQAAYKASIAAGIAADEAAIKAYAASQKITKAQAVGGAAGAAAEVTRETAIKYAISVCDKPIFDWLQSYPAGAVLSPPQQQYKDYYEQLIAKFIEDSAASSAAASSWTPTYTTTKDPVTGIVTRTIDPAPWSSNVPSLTLPWTYTKSDIILEAFRVQVGTAGVSNVRSSSGSGISGVSGTLSAEVGVPFRYIPPVPAPPPWVPWKPPPAGVSYPVPGAPTPPPEPGAPPPPAPPAPPPGVCNKIPKPLISKLVNKVNVQGLVTEGAIVTINRCGEVELDWSPTSTSGGVGSFSSGDAVAAGVLTKDLTIYIERTATYRLNFEDIDNPPVPQELIDRADPIVSEEYEWDFTPYPQPLNSTNGWTIAIEVKLEETNGIFWCKYFVPFLDPPNVSKTEDQWEEERHLDVYTLFKEHPGVAYQRLQDWVTVAGGVGTWSGRVVILEANVTGKVCDIYYQGGLLFEALQAPGKNFWLAHQEYVPGVTNGLPRGTGL